MDAHMCTNSVHVYTCVHPYGIEIRIYTYTYIHMSFIGADIEIRGKLAFMYACTHFGCWYFDTLCTLFVHMGASIRTYSYFACNVYAVTLYEYVRMDAHMCTNSVHSVSKYQNPKWVQAYINASLPRISIPALMKDIRMYAYFNTSADEGHTYIHRYIRVFQYQRRQGTYVYTYVYTRISIPAPMKDIRIYAYFNTSADEGHTYVYTRISIPAPMRDIRLYIHLHTYSAWPNLT